MNGVIQTDNPNKFYGSVHALHDVNLDVGEGETFGYLEPKGAGKTTTICTLLDLI